MSQFLSRIELALGETTDPERRGDLHIKKALYLARRGEFGDAKQIAQALRRNLPVERYPRIRIQIILLDGVVDLYESLSSHSYDRIKGSDLLAIAFGDRELISITSSWRAHVEFERSNFDEMGMALLRVQRAAEENSHEPRARVARILADCFALTGDRSQSKKWFEIAHRHAVGIGDQAMIDALIYNSMAFGLSRLRSESFTNNVDVAKLRLIETELSSAKTFQSLIGAKALVNLVDICSARLLMLKGDFQGALNYLNVTTDSGPWAKNNSSADLWRLELAFCEAKVGNIDAAIRSVSQIEDNSLPGIDVDDRLAGAWMANEMALLDSRLGSVAVTSINLERVKREFELYFFGLSQAIAGFEIKAST